MAYEKLELLIDGKTDRPHQTDDPLLEPRIVGDDDAPDSPTRIWM